mmetsp:Transcript_40139/g.72694  ORF Transcript_40139/g.72694 Transcript_40139/m.72694 type:complete len:256 (-) Transcript_40139:168-935(-)
MPRRTYFARDAFCIPPSNICSNFLSSSGNSSGASPAALSFFARWRRKSTTVSLRTLPSSRLLADALLLDAAVASKSSFCTIFAHVLRTAKAVFGAGTTFSGPELLGEAAGELVTAAGVAAGAGVFSEAFKSSADASFEASLFGSSLWLAGPGAAATEPLLPLPPDADGMASADRGASASTSFFPPITALAVASVFVPSGSSDMLDQSGLAWLDASESGQDGCAAAAAATGPVEPAASGIPQRQGPLTKRLEASSA